MVKVTVYRQINCLIFVTCRSFLSPPCSTAAFQPSHDIALSATMSRTSLASTDSNQEIEFITNTRCPYAQKAWIALESSNCEYQMREVSLYGAGGKPDWFWKLNPKGTVPVVVVKDGDKKTVLADSEDILDAVMDGKINGDGNMSIELNQNEHREVLKWRGIISKQLAPVGKSAVLGGSQTQLRLLLKELNSKVVGPYLTGDKFTMADAAAIPFFWRLNEEYGLGDDDTENLRTWLDKCIQNKAVGKTIPYEGWWWWW